MIFRNRQDAGRQLAERLQPTFQGQDAVVLGLPRGGVPVAFEVSQALGLPLDVIVVRKLGVPFQPELAMGAVGEGGVVVLNQEVLRLAGVGEREVALIEERERAEVERRAARFRGDRPQVSLAGRVAVLVDDGIATGATVRAACRVARAAGAARVVVAVPVAPLDTAAALRADADDVVCLQTPANFAAVGQWYADFTQTSDDEVNRLLHLAALASSGPLRVDLGARDEEVQVAAGGVGLPGRLTVPSGAQGVVVFAHGSGSSRHSPRNRAVATALNQEGLGTLLLDLLTPEEELHRANVFDVELLGERLLGATAWLRGQPGLADLPVGYFGASTGAAAALWAAADPSARVAAVVSRGGRPDLAGDRLPLVGAPTLLIVGGNDPVVLDLNRDAASRLRFCEHQLRVVPGATHLFEEPGTLKQVADLAGDWFGTHLQRQRATSSG